MLTLLDLSRNNLTGSLPRTLVHLEYLTALQLSSNMLSGELPAEIFYLKQLSTIDLSATDITGEIPDTIGCGTAAAVTRPCTGCCGLGAAAAAQPQQGMRRSWGAVAHALARCLALRPMPAATTPAGTPQA
jgi:hypothetical protein